MTRAQARFRTIVARFGEDLGGSPAVVVPLAFAKAHDYLTDAEIDAATRPLWLATTGYDHMAVEGSAVVWRTRSLTVKRAIDVRFAGTTISRLLVLTGTTSGTSSGGGGGGTSPGTGVSSTTS